VEEENEEMDSYTDKKLMEMSYRTREFDDDENKYQETIPIPIPVEIYNKT